MDDGEEILSGGSVAAAVVRIGDTVRRPWERWTPAVHGFLRHLEKVGFAAAPRPSGCDEQRREVLTYLEGETCRRPWLPVLRTDGGLTALTRLVKDLHDASASFQPPPDAEWVDGVRGPADGEIICHGDIGPWNTVWRDDEPVGIIDWDFARPMHPMDDPAYVAFYAVPLRDDDHCRESGFDTPPDRAHRLNIVCTTYGDVDARDLWRRAEQHHQRDVDEIEVLGRQGLHPWRGFLERGYHDEARAMLQWLQDNRHVVTG